MKLTDIIALATKGYKPSDIKELIEFANESEKDPESIPAEEQNEPESIPAEEQNEPEIDYRSELEKLKAETEKLKADLQAAQAANRAARTPEVERPSREESLKDIARAMMR